MREREEASFHQGTVLSFVLTLVVSSFSVKYHLSAAFFCSSDGLPLSSQSQSTFGFTKPFQLIKTVILEFETRTFRPIFVHCLFQS